MSVTDRRKFLKAGGLTAIAMTPVAQLLAPLEALAQAKPYCLPGRSKKGQVISIDLYTPGIDKWNSFHLYAKDGDAWSEDLHDLVKKYFGDQESVVIQNRAFVPNAQNASKFSDFAKELRNLKSSPFRVFYQGLEGITEQNARDPKTKKINPKYAAAIANLSSGGHMKDLYISGNWPGHEMSWEVFINNVIVGQLALGQRPDQQKDPKARQIMGIQYDRFEWPDAAAISKICEFDGQFLRYSGNVRTPSQDKSNNKKPYSFDIQLPISELSAAIGARVDERFVKDVLMNKDHAQYRVYRLKLGAYIEDVIATRSVAELCDIYKIDSHGKHGQLHGDTLAQKMRREKWSADAAVLPHVVGGYSRDEKFSFVTDTARIKPYCCCDDKVVAPPVCPK